MEICRQLAYIDMKYRAKHHSGVSFPIELTYFICNSVFDALNLELEFKKLNFQLYGAQVNFDAKGFVVAHLTLRKDFTHALNMEDFWADYCDEFEVGKRAHQRFTLQQVMAYDLKMNVANVEDDDSELIDHKFVDSRQKGVIPEVDWDKDEEDHIQARTFSVVRRTEQWLRGQRMGRISRKNPTSSTEVPVANSLVTPCVEGSSKIWVRTKQATRPAKVKKESAPTRITQSKARNKVKQPSMNIVVVDLDVPPDIDNTSAHPDLEVQNIDNASDNQ